MNESEGKDTSSSLLKGSKLLRKLLDEEVDEITPSIDFISEYEVRYPIFEDLVGYSRSKINEILESLVKKDILKRELFDQVPICPNCQSKKIKVSLRCPNCNSFNIEKEEMLEHLPCGAVRPRIDFKHGNELICPKCGERLEAIGVDYSRMGRSYICNECGEKFDLPLLQWRCFTCSTSFSSTEFEMEPIYAYRLNKKMKKRVEKWVTQHQGARKRMEEFLKQQGYNVDTSVHIQGESGIDYTVAIYADHKERNEKIVAEFTQDLSLNEVTRLHVVAQDINATAFLVTSVEPIKPEIRNFAKQFDVSILHLGGKE